MADAGYGLVPVDHQGADAGYSLVPVDHDPFDPLAASAGVAPAGTPRIDQIDWGQLSWTQQALEQSRRDQEAFAKEGVRGMLRDTEGTQDLASGFGGDAGFAGTTKAVGTELAKTAPRFYSAVEDTIANAKMGQAPAQQWMGMLKNAPGVKPEELEHLGIEDFLTGQNGPITKQALQEHIAGNKVDVQDVHKGEYRPQDLDEGKYHDELESAAQHQFGTPYDHLTNSQQADVRRLALARQNIYPTKFSQYTLPGGENYRELLLTLPEKPNTQSFDEWLSEMQQHAGDFRSSHWDEPNVLAHVRFDDRNIGGDKTLHMAEIQSDWHQKGRREGYATGDPEFDEEFRRGAVPDAPFKTTWPELALKRMIRYAAENGYDRISWDTGITNAERYDLSKHINQIEYIRNQDGTYRVGVTGRTGDGVDIPNSDRMTAQDVENTFGKEIAQKFENNEGKRYRGHEGNMLEGLDLKVGGEGMKGFYDRMLPNVANKLVKKYGARVESSRLTEKDQSIANDSPAHAAALGITPVHSIKITPALRDHALQRGFPMFAKGGAVTNKSTKTEAHYRGGNAAKHCSICTMFVRPNRCTSVRGTISPRGLCDFYEPKAGRKSGGAVNGTHIDASHTVRTGANSSADGKTVFIDRCIPDKFRKFLTVHETVEQKHMAGGYDRAHKIATAAERKAVEAAGINWRHYTAEIDGYLDHIEHEHDTNPPPVKLHVPVGMALDHHRSHRKKAV